MKIGKIILALLLTLVLLFIARQLAMVQPRWFEATMNGITLSHLNPGKAPQNQQMTMESKAAPLGSDQKVVLRYNSGAQGSWESMEMLPSGSNPASLSISLLGKPKGSRLFYFIEVRDISGNVLANLGTQANPLRLRFEGTVPGYLIGPHIFCMFAGAFFSFLALFGAVSLLRNRGDMNSVAKNVGWATLFTFIGGIPLGIMVARAAVGGTGWGGFPLGNDITDNKTLLILLYWLVLVILGKGSIFQNNPGTNLVKASTFGKLTLIGFILVLGLYLIPHSI